MGLMPNLRGKQWDFKEEFSVWVVLEKKFKLEWSFGVPSQSLLGLRGPGSLEVAAIIWKPW